MKCHNHRATTGSARNISKPIWLKKNIRPGRFGPDTSHLSVLDPDISHHAESDPYVSHANCLDCFTPGLYELGRFASVPFIILFQEDNIFGTNTSLTYGPQIQRHTCV